MTKIIDGKAFADGLGAKIAQTIPRLAEQAGRPPGLAVVLVGTDPASEIYVIANDSLYRFARR